MYTPDIQLSRDFHLIEFMCKDGSESVVVTYPMIRLLQRVRDYVNRPVIITENGGYRTPAWNIKCGGSIGSQHLLGNAADIVVDGISSPELARVGLILGAKGIGVYDIHTHLDTREMVVNTEDRYYDFWNLSTKYKEVGTEWIGRNL